MLAHHNRRFQLIQEAKATAANVAITQHTCMLSSHLICISSSCYQGSASPPSCFSSTITQQLEQKKPCLAFHCSKKQSTPKEAHFTSHLCSFKLENESLAGECVNPANTCFGQFLNFSLHLYFSPQHVEVILHTEFYCKLQHLPQQLLPFIICLKNMCRIWFGSVTGNRFLT